MLKQIMDHFGMEEQIKKLREECLEFLESGEDEEIADIKGDYMEREKLDAILSEHKKWLDNSKLGRRANLRHANLSYANLHYANLSYANLRHANLIDANLIDANLSYANLIDANLIDANLSYANLRHANLIDANLSNADLSNANLDFSVLPLWCGGQFKADEKICKQLVAHTVRIMELSEIEEPELIKMMNEYKKGWHREKEF